MINTIKQLAYELKCFPHDIERIVNVSDYYRSHEVAKKKYGMEQIYDGKVLFRSLDVSITDLRGIQKKIHCYFQKKFPLPSYAYGSVKGKNNIENAKFHAGSKYFLTIDLKNFFSRISNSQVYQMFRDNDFSPTTSRLLTQLTTYQGCLPQGAPTSPMIANMVFMNTASKLQEAILPFGILFSTFLDDLAFSSKKDFKGMVQEILQIISSSGFLPHNRKIKYCTYCPEITGLVINDGRLYMVDIMWKRALENPNLNDYRKAIQKANSGFERIDSKVKLTA